MLREIKERLHDFRTQAMCMNLLLLDKHMGLLNAFGNDLNVSR